MSSGSTSPIDEVDIPDDRILMAELSGRQYDYDSKGRRKIEPKMTTRNVVGNHPTVSLLELWY